MKKLFCDRCDKEIKHPTLANEVTIFDCVYELCQECKVEFKILSDKWLAKKEKGKVA